MTWVNNDGRATSSNIPAAVRRFVRRRDGDTCQLGYVGCTGKHQVFDHIVNVKRLGLPREQTLTPEFLQCACRHCNKVKAQWEAKMGKGLGPQDIEPSHRVGRVELPSGWRYAPPAAEQHAPPATEPLPAPAPIAHGAGARVGTSPGHGRTTVDVGPLISPGFGTLP